MSTEADVVVVGAGVIGLATAAALARCGRSVIVVERNPVVAQEISSRNSEVIHAGIYYPTGSLKATLCVAGQKMLYVRCAERGIPHRKIGKLIVAAEVSEVAALEALCERGFANGLTGLEIIGREEVHRREPEVRCEAALVSTETGILDVHALSLSFLAEAESFGALLALCGRAPFLMRWSGRWLGRGWLADRGHGPTRLLPEPEGESFQRWWRRERGS